MKPGDRAGELRLCGGEKPWSPPPRGDREPDGDGGGPDPRESIGAVSLQLRDRRPGRGGERRARRRAGRPTSRGRGARRRRSASAVRARRSWSDPRRPPGADDPGPPPRPALPPIRIAVAGHHDQAPAPLPAPTVPGDRRGDGLASVVLGDREELQKTDALALSATGADGGAGPVVGDQPDRLAAGEGGVADRGRQRDRVLEAGLRCLADMDARAEVEDDQQVDALPGLVLAAHQPPGAGRRRPVDPVQTILGGVFADRRHLGGQVQNTSVLELAQRTTHPQRPEHGLDGVDGRVDQDRAALPDPKGAGEQSKRITETHVERPEGDLPAAAEHTPRGPGHRAAGVERAGPPGCIAGQPGRS